jgi:hypothetical protein
MSGKINAMALNARSKVWTGAAIFPNDAQSCARQKEKARCQVDRRQ